MLACRQLDKKHRNPLLTQLLLHSWSVLNLIRLQECQENKAAAVGPNGNKALSFPGGIATDGVRVWIADLNAQVRVCSFVGTTLTDCRYTTSQTNGLRGSGNIAVDLRRGLIFAVLDQQGCVMVCRNIFIMDMKCPCYTFDPISSTNYNPSGLAIGFDTLWVTSSAGVSRCPLTSAGFDFNRCTTTVIIDPTTANVAYNTMGILVDTTGQGTVYIADNSGQAEPPLGPSMLACNVALTSCIKSEGDGTFQSGKQPPTAGPGYIGMALASGKLYIPLMNPPVSDISICSDPSTISGCKFARYSLTPDRAGKDTVNLAIIPPPTTTAAMQIITDSGVITDDSSSNLAITTLRRYWRTGILGPAASVVHAEGNTGVRDATVPSSSPQPGTSIEGAVVSSWGDAVDAIAVPGGASQAVAADPSSATTVAQPAVAQGGAVLTPEPGASGVAQPAVLDGSVSIEQLPGAVAVITRPFVSTTSLVSLPGGEVTEDDVRNRVCTLGTGGILPGR